MLNFTVYIIFDCKTYDLTIHKTVANAEKALNYITQFSPFRNAYIIQSQFEKIKTHGTHVVIFNLRTAELDFSISIVNQMRISALT